MFKRESGFVILENEVVDYQIGTAGSVEFDFFKVWERWKQTKPSSMIMFHTHPTGFTNASSTDYNMLSGWSLAFPIKIYFGVWAVDSFYIQWYLGYKNNIIHLGKELRKYKQFSCHLMTESSNDTILDPSTFEDFEDDFSNITLDMS